MALTDEEQTKMFGATVKQLDEEWTEKLSSDRIYLQSMLSDVQEMILLKKDETARQVLNKAKYFISTKLK